MLRWLLAATATILVATAARAEPPFSAPVVNDAGATLSAAFGQRTNAAGDNVFHPGVDVAAPNGTAVHAPAAGRVMRVHAAGALGGYTGQVVEIDHGEGVRTRISGLEGAELSPDAAINAGDAIGRIAARDDGVVAHLHLEVWRDGRVYDPAMQISLIAQAN